MSTKAYYPISEIGAGKPGFSKTRSIIEGAFYGNNVIKVNTLREAYELAKNSPGTVVTDMPIYKAEQQGLERDSKVLLFNDGAVTGRYAQARRIKGEPGVDAGKLDKVVMDAIYKTRWMTMYHAEVYIGLDPEFMVKAHLLIPEGEENIMYNWMLNFQYLSDEYVRMYQESLPVGNGNESDIYICDLGLDRVARYDAKTRTLQDTTLLQLKDGPRHMCFGTANVAYLITEYSNVIYTLTRDPATGILTPRRCHSTLPSDFNGESFGASVDYSTRHGLVYASNRGHDSVAVFETDERGMITQAVACCSCGGCWPRHIALSADQKFLFCANQRSDTVSVLPLDEDGVPMAPVEQISVKGASFVRDLAR